MSWFNLFKRMKDNPELSPDEVDLLRMQARNEVDDVLGTTYAVSVTVVNDDDLDFEGATPDSDDENVAYHRVNAHHPTLLRGTSRAQVLPLRDWRTIEGAGSELGITPEKVEALCRRHGLAMIDFPRCSPLVHVRQIAYFNQHGTVLDVDTTVFDGWDRQARLAEMTGVPAQVLSKLAAAGDIAVFKPALKCVLYNVQEVNHVLRREGLL